MVKAKPRDSMVYEVLKGDLRRWKRVQFPVEKSKCILVVDKRGRMPSTHHVHHMEKTFERKETSTTKLCW